MKEFFDGLFDDFEDKAGMTLSFLFCAFLITVFIVFFGVWFILVIISIISVYLIMHFLHKKYLQ